MPGCSSTGGILTTADRRQRSPATVGIVAQRPSGSKTIQRPGGGDGPVQIPAHHAGDQHAADQFTDHMDDAAGAEERYAPIPEQHQVHAVFQGHQGAGRHGDRQVEHAVPGERERQFGEHALQRRGREHEPERELVAQQHLGRAAHQVHINRGSGLTQDDDGQRAGEIPLKPEGLRRNSAQSGTHGQETARCAKNSVGTAIGGVDRYNQSFLSGLAQTLRASGGGDCTPTVLAPVAVYCHQGNGIDRADTAGCNGKGVCEDKCYTLNTIDRHAVCFPQQAYNKFIQEDIEATLKASGGTYGGGSENLVAEQSFSPIRYIVRRLTPTECARLQGFPDCWGEIPKKDNLTDDEYTFWLNVRNTYAKINNKTTKEYSKEQMLSWYNKLHSDSSEYKMWGNGIALPNALYVMQGIAAEAEIPINLF